MSYALAYTTHFRSLDNMLWEIGIYIDGFEGRTIEIKLEGDEPCVIEWQETDKMDVVQSSTCTLRVSNESDRQMMQLMNSGLAACIVSRDGKWYWVGYLDDSIYEEPYSFVKGYVTEITFSDFGLLNRRPFEMKGRQSIKAIVRDCIYPLFGDIAINLYTSLINPKTQLPIRLEDIYINADRFESDDDSWGSMTTKREVLEDILRPLGLRIIQRNAQAYIYDIEYLRDHQELQEAVVWKGTDAVMKGSETYGWYEVAFEPDAKDTLSEINLDPYDRTVPKRVCAHYYDKDADEHGEGFYIDIATVYFPDGTRPKVFKTCSGLSSSDDVGIPYRVKATKPKPHLAAIPSIVYDNEYVRWPVVSPNQWDAVASELFKIESGYIPLVPDRDKYQMRVNLDLLLSFLVNPAEGDEDWNVTTFGYGLTKKQYKNNWKEKMLRAYVPVKLELLDANGTVLMHYRNTLTVLSNYSHHPVPPGEGEWEAGSAVFSDMLLAYYNDGLESTPFEGWATNRQTMVAAEINGSKHLPSLYRKREQGEYVPMPPMAGMLRLTVSNCIYSLPYPSVYPSTELLKWLNWQLYRNPKITIVRSNRTDDEINTDDIYERDCLFLYGDHLSESVKAGSWVKGMAPSSRGLLFDSSGNVYERFLKDGRNRTLTELRLLALEDQTMGVQPVLSGTAELDHLFHAKTEHSTPGVFVVTGLRQNLQQGIEEVTMARIANVSNFFYEFAWSNPICEEEEEPYVFSWGSPVCVTEPRFSFEWRKPVCVTKYTYTLEWEEMQSFD